MESDEKKIMQEDCSEDSLGAGILTLTNRRVAFDKTGGRIFDFSKKFGDTVINAELDKITNVSKEGMFIKKVVVTVKTEEGEKTYKFGVFNTGKWSKTIQEAVSKYKH